MAESQVGRLCLQLPHPHAHGTVSMTIKAGVRTLGMTCLPLPETDSRCPSREHCGTPRSMLTHTWMMPLNVAATSVKFEMPPPTMSARPRPSAPAVATSSIVFAYAYVSCLSGNKVLPTGDWTTADHCLAVPRCLAHASPAHHPPEGGGHWSARPSKLQGKQRTKGFLECLWV